MIDYLIKLDYVLGYKRHYEQNNPLKPEDTCQLLMTVKFTNLLILSMYPTVGLFRYYNLLGHNLVTYVWVGILVLADFWFYFGIKDRIYKSPIRKIIKKMPDEERRKYIILSYLYTLGTLVLWILAFTWPVILYGTSVMVTPQ